MRREACRVQVAGLYSEYVASLALCEACSGSDQRATSLVEEATSRRLNAETEVMCAWVAAITACRRREDPKVRDAFALTVDRGHIDGFVVAYRAYPTLLERLIDDPDIAPRVEEILIRANDFELAQRVAPAKVSREAHRQRLTKRELDVYRLMVDGLSNRLIAKRLYISEPTAKLHVRHILEKLSSRSRAEAVAKWRDVLDA
jgi:DNA-binding CsgD family transcriptional regulator